MPGLDRVESFALIDQPSIRPRQRPADRGGGRRPLRRRHFGSVSSERTAHHGVSCLIGLGWRPSRVPPCCVYKAGPDAHRLTIGWKKPELSPYVGAREPADPPPRRAPPAVAPGAARRAKPPRSASPCRSPASPCRSPAGPGWPEAGRSRKRSVVLPLSLYKR